MTLLEWAQDYCDSGPERLAVFVRLKEIATTGDDLIAHVARLESEGHVQEAAWKALAQSGMLTLFCDGWNELNDSERNAMGPKLAMHARTYPSAGLVIGTRSHSSFPLRGPHIVLTLHRLLIEQVRAVVKERLGDGASAALAELRQSRPLRDLVRTPFFLSSFCETRLAGATPTTREGLIRGLIVAGEQRPEHAGPLWQALAGQQSKYLRALSVKMLQKQQADLSSDDTLRTINQQTAALRQDGLLAKPLSESVVLATLRDHHCLIEHTGADPTFRLQHQLINEWYAAEEVRRVALLCFQEKEARKRLDDEILDHAAWTESVLFAAEKPSDCDGGIAATSHLILRALGISPEFAADVIAVAPTEVWQVVAPTVHSFLERWQATAKPRVLQFALRCGKEDFSDIVWDAIAAEDSGRQALHASRFIHPRALGPNWRQRCAALSANGRADLLAMLASDSGLEGAAMAVEAAIADDEPKVQAAVAGMLDFYGYADELAELLRAAHPQTWEELMRTQNVEGLWEQPWRASAIEATHRIFASLGPAPQGIGYALKLRSLGEDVDADLVNELLALTFENHHDEDRLYARVAEAEGARLSEALFERALAGQRVPYHASRYLRKDTPVSQQCLLAACRQKPHHLHHDILSPLLDAASLTTLYSELVTANAAYREATGQDRKELSDTYQILEDALTKADKNALAGVFLSLAPRGAEEIAEAGRIIMRAYRDDYGRDKREPLRPELRDRVVELLARWAERLLADDTCTRHALHSLAEAIATFPSTKLLTPLRDLLSAELRIWRSEKEEFNGSIERGQRPAPASGARISYAYRYAQNMLGLATGRNPDIAPDDDNEEGAPVSHEMADVVIDVLADFILDYEFGEEAARAIATLRPDPILKIGKPRRFMSYDVRVAEERREARRRAGTDAAGPIMEKLLDGIDRLRREGSPKALQHAIALSHSAVRMGCGKALSSLTELVVQHGSLEAVSKHMLLRLVFGHDVYGEIAERCLDQLDARRQERNWEYQQSWFKWQELLVLMVCGGKPLQAANRMLKYEYQGQHHDERTIIEALGVCGHADALQALAVLRERCVEHRITDEWLSAVHAIGSAEAGDMLLTAFLELPEKHDWHTRRTASEKIADLAGKHVDLRERLLDIARNGEQRKLGRVGEICRHVDQEEFFVKLVALPSERLAALNGAIAEALRNLCIEYRPIAASAGAYDLVPRPARMVRSALFARASADDPGAAVCRKLLEHMEDLRDDYGAPAEETRHPDIRVGEPWPTVARLAWDASARLVQGASGKASSE